MRPRNPGNRPRRRMGIGLLAVVLALSAAGCETGFDPFIPSENRFFSIGGYLDALADTQFVRVAPIRDTFLPGAAPFDAVVSLTHVASGRRTLWRDSLFTIGGAVVHNYWSAEPLLAGERYRFAVERSDGAASAATIVLPDSFPDPVRCAAAENGLLLPPLFVVQEVNRIAEVQLVYDLRLRSDPAGRRRTHAVSYRDDLRITSFGHNGVVNVFEDLFTILTTNGYGSADFTVLDARVRVAATGPDWPDAAYDLEALALPGVVSNVEAGLGYLGGVAVREVPWPDLLYYLNASGIPVSAEIPAAPVASDLCQIIRGMLEGNS